MVIELSSCTLNVNPVRLDVIQCSEEEISIQRILIRGHQEQMKLHKQLEIRQIAHLAMPYEICSEGNNCYGSDDRQKPMGVQGSGYLGKILPRRNS